MSDTAKPLLQLEIERLVASHDLAMPEHRALVVKDACQPISSVADHVVRFEYVRFVSRICGVSMYRVNALTEEYRRALDHDD